MTRDQKHRVPGLRQPRKPPPANWASIVLPGGILLLAALFLGYRWQQSQRPAVAAAPTAPAPAAARITFFRILPEVEIRVEDSEISAVKRESRLGKAPRPGQFFVQAGTFKQREHALDLKARLEALGELHPQLEQLNLDNAIWCRIKLGPYATIPEAEQVRRFLREHKLDSIMQTPANPTETG
jgi:cell division protein FtsN